MAEQAREGFRYRTIGLDLKLDREIQKRTQERGEKAAVVMRDLLRKAVESERTETDPDLAEAVA